MIYEIFKSTILVLALFFCNSWSGALGGLFFSVFSLATRIPYIGKIFGFILNKKVKTIVVIKFISWLISSSGVLLGYLLFWSFFGSPTNTAEFIIILVFSISAVINIAYDLALFQMDTFSEHLKNGRFIFEKVFKDKELDFLYKDEKAQKSLSRSLFIDLHLPQLFRLLFSIGMTYFSLGNLGILQVKNGEVVGILNSIQSAYSTIPIVGSASPIFEGQYWQVCSIIASFLVFLWTVFFISAAQSMFSDEEKLNDEDENQPEVNVDAKFLEQFRKDLENHLGIEPKPIDKAEEIIATAPNPKETTTTEPPKITNKE